MLLFAASPEEYAIEDNVNVRGVSEKLGDHVNASKSTLNPEIVDLSEPVPLSVPEMVSAFASAVPAARREAIAMRYFIIFFS